MTLGAKHNQFSQSMLFDCLRLCPALFGLGSLVRFAALASFNHCFPGDAAEVREGPHMALQKGFCGLGRKRGHEAVIGMRQIHQ